MTENFPVIVRNELMSSQLLPLPQGRSSSSKLCSTKYEWQPHAMTIAIKENNFSSSLSSSFSGLLTRSLGFTKFGKILHI